MSFPYNADIDQWTLTWRDAKGNIAKNKFYVDFSGSSGVTDAQSWEVTTLPLLKALTNAAIQRTAGAESQYGVLQYGAHAPSDYQTAEMKAVLVFQATDGSLHRFQIPAPKVALFMADRQTINPTQTNVAAFIAQMTAPDLNGVFACTRDDRPFVNFIGGYFRAAKLQRRANITVLTPDLNPGEPEE